MSSASRDEPCVLAVSATRCDAAAGCEPRTARSHCSYRVAWQINPHMRIGAANPVRAEAQHTRFVTALERAGAQVLRLPFVHGAFDSVFAKDSAVLHTRGRTFRALLSRFQEEWRQREQRERRHALETLGFEIVDVGRHPLEGGDVVRIPGLTLLGHGLRSSVHARAALEDALDEEVLPLRLVDPWLYHLDTALTALADGTLLVCREAFSDESLKRLLQHPKVRALQFVPHAEAKRFALNLVQVGRRIVTGTRAPVTEAILRRKALEIEVVPLDEFQLAGGSAACLVARLHLEPAVVRDVSMGWSTSA